MPATPNGINSVSAASGPYAAELSASKPKIGIPADTPISSALASSDANGRPRRISANDMAGLSYGVGKLPNFVFQAAASSVTTKDLANQITSSTIRNLCFGGFSRLSGITRAAGGLPAANLARLRASFDAENFLRFFFIQDSCCRLRLPLHPAIPRTFTFSRIGKPLTTAAFPVCHSIPAKMTSAARTEANVSTARPFSEVTALRSASIQMAQRIPALPADQISAARRHSPNDLQHASAPSSAIPASRNR